MQRSLTLFPSLKVEQVESSFGMRRAVPWLLIGLLIAGGGTAAGLGAVMQPSTPAPAVSILQRVFAATEAAGSARFSFTSVTESSNRYLRSSDEGSGVVDFKTGNWSSEETNRGVSFASSGTGPLRPMVQVTSTKQIEIAGSAYLLLSNAGIPSGALPWVRIPSSATGRGLLGVLGRSTELGLFPGPAHLITVSIGSAQVGGSTTIRYAFAPAASCLTSSRSSRIQLALGAFDIWVDRADRLLEIETSISETTPPGALPAPLGKESVGTSTTTSTLRFNGFGTSIRLVAPVIRRFAVSSTSVSTMVQRSGCSSGLAPKSGWIEIAGGS
jgi:hypothetical protein